MIGAIIGDVIGSAYEWHPVKTKEFELFNNETHFTDDTVLTVATADAIIHDGNYAAAYHRWGREFPFAGYGGNFWHWLCSSKMEPYNSFGNGAAMRVAPIGLAFPTEREVLAEAERSAIVTHDHPEGIKGAQAVALAVFLAKKGVDKQTIKQEVSSRFDYNLNRTLDEIRPDFKHEVTCQKTVPEAIIAFLEADSYIEAVRGAISLGGDADTLACIAGAIAEAFFGRDNIAVKIINETKEHLAIEMCEMLDAYDAYLAGDRHGLAKRKA